MRPIIASSPSQKVAAKATFRHSVSSPSDSQIGSYHRAMVGADHRAARDQCPTLKQPPYQRYVKYLQHITRKKVSCMSHFLCSKLYDVIGGGTFVPLARCAQ